MRLTKKRNKYILLNSTFGQKNIPKEAGFFWDRDAKFWYTNKPLVALKLKQYADKPTSKKLAIAQQQQQDMIDESSATDSDIQIPHPVGLSYLPFQRAGIAYALQRDAVLIGDEPGLGKTIQALGIANATDAQSILVVCPASLRLNWKKESEKWLVHNLSIGVAVGSNLPDTDMVIINYDIISRHRKALDKRTWDLAIMDEAHYCKNKRTQRARSLFGEYSTKKKSWIIKPFPAKRKVLLTGTPIVNRPFELFPLINYLNPKKWPNAFKFAQKFCKAIHNGWGWDFSGHQNLEELQTELRTDCMVRRLKKDVLQDLPPKRRQIIELPESSAVEAERQAWQRSEETLIELRAQVQLARVSDDPKAYADAVKKFAEENMVAFTDMAEVRKETALVKVPYVIEHVADSAESAPVVVFAHHHAVIDQLASGLRERDLRVVTLTGKDSMVNRNTSVDLFQSGEADVIILNIQAGGVGLTLTKSSHVVFAELDFVPGNMSQAEDRCHRISQEDKVLVQHIVLEGSLDAHIARMLVEKQAVLDGALDEEIHWDKVCPILPVSDAVEISDKELSQVVDPLPSMAVDAIHDGLKLLTASCDGATSWDDRGYSKFDTTVGKSLSRSPFLTPKQQRLGQKLIHKYRRQLDPDLVAVATQGGN